jgi:hypothetical protein
VKSRIALVAAVLGAGLCVGALAACGGRVDSSTVAACSAPALAYCQANGCAVAGPSAGTAAAVTAWCASWPALAPRVTGFGTCTTSAGDTWAIDVRTADANGGTVYLLFDPASGQLVSVSTLEPGGAGGDGGPVETDYGTCGERHGIVTCSGVAFACSP